MWAIKLNKQLWEAANGPAEARMKYRGVEYRIVRIEGGARKWSASVDGVSITGSATSELGAVAEHTIDRAPALKKLRLLRDNRID
jgi:hypothetical protein